MYRLKKRIRLSNRIKKDINMAELRFLKMYEKEPSLWKTNHPHFRDSTQRTASSERIAAAMGFDDFGVEQVGEAFRKLSSTYHEELAKKTKTKDYKPTVEWFNTMDSFMNRLSNQNKDYHSDSDNSDDTMMGDDDDQTAVSEDDPRAVLKSLDKEKKTAVEDFSNVSFSALNLVKDKNVPEVSFAALNLVKERKPTSEEVPSAAFRVLRNSRKPESEEDSNPALALKGNRKFAAENVSNCSFSSLVKEKKPASKENPIDAIHTVSKDIQSVSEDDTNAQMSEEKKSASELEADTEFDALIEERISASENDSNNAFDALIEEKLSASEQELSNVFDGLINEKTIGSDHDSFEIPVSEKTSASGHDPCEMPVSEKTTANDDQDLREKPVSEKTIANDDHDPSEKPISEKTIANDDPDPSEKPVSEKTIANDDTDPCEKPVSEKTIANDGDPSEEEAVCEKASTSECHPITPSDTAAEDKQTASESDLSTKRNGDTVASECNEDTQVDKKKAADPQTASNGTVKSPMTPPHEAEVYSSCDVCRSWDTEDNNVMVFCDSCDVCVHQACYGVDSIPEGDWYCRPCEAGVKPMCVLCPKKRGAMKQTSERKWAHVSCALWIREVSFVFPDEMEMIRGVSKIPKQRWNLKCTVCHIRRGACIQCSVRMCRMAYHVTCALHAGLEMRMVDVSPTEEMIKLESFCFKHSKPLTPPIKQESGRPRKKLGRPAGKNKQEGIEAKEYKADEKIRNLDGTMTRDSIALSETKDLTSKVSDDRPVVGDASDGQPTTCQDSSNYDADRKPFVHLQDLKSLSNGAILLLSSSNGEGKIKTTARKSFTGRGKHYAADDDLESQPSTHSEQPPFSTSSEHNSRYGKLRQSTNHQSSSSIKNKLRSQAARSYPNESYSPETKHQSRAISKRAKTRGAKRKRTNSSQKSSSLERRGEDDNLEGFTKYITSLLRTVPPKRVLKVQKKVISLIYKELDVSSSEEYVLTSLSSESD